MLADEELGLTGCSDHCLLDSGDGGVEFLDGGRGDGDEAGAAEDAVCDGEVDFLRDTPWYSAVREASSISPIFARWAWSDLTCTA